MLKVKVLEEKPVKYLKASMGVRYWEDATVNDNPEGDDPTIPFGSADRWNITIDLETGKIDGWPEGVVAKTHYKVCDDGVYTLLNAGGEKVCEIDGYVPSMLCPEESGYGDYVIMNIDGTGAIQGWRVDLNEFQPERK